MLAGSDSKLLHTEEMVDDPRVRCPDLALAREQLGWEPVVPLDEGLDRTVNWAREAWI